MVGGAQPGVYSKVGPIGANAIVPVGPIVDHGRPHDRGRFAVAASRAGGRLGRRLIEGAIWFG
jgi:hypothetical protein